jgi:hypothetical protein
MKPTQERAGCYWQSNDSADIWLNDSGVEPPTTISCMTPNGGTAIVKIDEMEFIGAGLFGEGRPSPGLEGVKWTGNSYRYGIYLTPKPYSNQAVAILESSGGGMRGLFLDRTISADMWKHLAATSTPEMLWNICHELHELHRAALDGEKRRVYAAFIEGRLKKTRRNRQIYVTEVSAA